ncbi:hypothetical protein EVAR_72316_1 [Eumeta japonica]|uniref:Uncharacterized protein n=1 Tax=Eumeta variegata TaxID=151549 RepID=A0A4C1SDT6_EUMVA|nr:hypothetical protein EVAR_72316_1 [Eumeta japonica]
MRNKSQSTEVFEQPHEEGTIYLYGGRRRVAKAPSTTNIYDRVKHLNRQAQKYNSRLNLPQPEQRGKHNNNDHDTLNLIPPLRYGEAKRMNKDVV